MADENIPVAAEELPVALSDSESDSLSSDTDLQRAVVFAAPREVVQPLGEQEVPVHAPADARNAAGNAHNSLAELVSVTDTTTALDAETHCLATAVFFESRSESLEGQLAVARVIINRAESPRFAKSLCSVVLQPKQFSFVRRGKLPTPKVKRAAWKTAIAIARIAQNNSWESEAEGALFFHARYVSPTWRTRPRLASIDNHIFYR